MRIDKSVVASTVINVAPSVDRVVVRVDNQFGWLLKNNAKKFGKRFVAKSSVFFSFLYVKCFVVCERRAFIGSTNEAKSLST